MGFDKHSLKFLQEIVLRKYDYKLGNVLTLGRQFVCMLDRRKTVEYVDEFIFPEHGARCTHSIDISLEESPTFQCDFGKPIDQVLSNKIEYYDTIWDGGTLEHIYNVPVALENVKKLLKVDGIFVSQCALNGMAGHGFYTLSPELFFKTFCKPEYTQQESYIYRLGPFAKVRKLKTPFLYRRIEITSFIPTMQFFIAKKVSGNVEKNHFEKTQAPPTMDIGFWKFWLWHTRVWGGQFE